MLSEIRWSGVEEDETHIDDSTWGAGTASMQSRSWLVHADSEKRPCHVQLSSANKER